MRLDLKVNSLDPLFVYKGRITSRSDFFNGLRGREFRSQVLAEDPIEFLSAAFNAIATEALPILKSGSLEISRSPKLAALGASEVFQLEGEVLGFLTSGSTGEAKVFLKTWENLLQEVFYLKDLMDVSDADQFLSLVPPHHLYGFLFSFLLPIVTGASCELLPSASVLDSLQTSGRLNTIIITTPALWPLAQKHISDATRLIVTSGAPLGTKNEESFISLRQNTSIKMIEFLGSTETGGFGYRVVGESREFNLFDSVSLESVGEACILRSPYIFRSLNPFFLSDQLEVRGRKFSLNGRSDRIVKISGKRFSLANIEDKLLKILPEQTQSVLCQFVEDAELPKGGLLFAVVELPAAVEINYQALRSQFSGDFDGAFPDRITKLEKIPRNSMGKLQMSEILKCMKS